MLILTVSSVNILPLLISHVTTIYSGEAISVEMRSLLQASGLRTRVLSHHMRELVRGQFIVRSKDITLQECIGEGG